MNSLLNFRTIKIFFAAALLSSIHSIALAAETSVHDVYVLADAGRIEEAQQAMQQVLRDHPKSATAHFVEAELLARQNRLSAARGELETAERLQPGLTSVSPESVRKLRARLSGNSAIVERGFASSPRSQSSFSWGPVIVGVLVLIVIAMVIKSLLRRASNPPANTMSMPPPIGGSYGPGMQPMSGGGLGGGLMGGLATGAAMGAGLVAGEVLAHKLMDDDHPRHAAPPAQDNFTDNDLGGTDFGVSDSSWDSGDSGGGDGGGGWD